MRNAFIFVCGFVACGLISLVFIVYLFTEVIGGTAKTIGTGLEIVYDSGGYAARQNNKFQNSANGKEQNLPLESDLDPNTNYLNVIKDLARNKMAHPVSSDYKPEQWREIKYTAVELLNSPNSDEVEKAIWILRYAFDYHSTWRLLILAENKNKFRKLVVETLTYNDQKTCRIKGVLSSLLENKEVTFEEKKIAKEALAILKNQCSWAS